MPMRYNAGLGMAVLEKVDEIALSNAPHAVGAGAYRCLPNSEMLSPAKWFYRRFPSPDIKVLTDMEKQLRVEGQKIADAMGLEIAFEKVGGFDPVTFDENCVSACAMRQNGWGIAI